MATIKQAQVALERLGISAHRYRQKVDRFLVDGKGYREYDWAHESVFYAAEYLHRAGRVERAHERLEKRIAETKLGRGTDGN